MNVEKVLEMSKKLNGDVTDIDAQGKDGINNFLVKFEDCPLALEDYEFLTGRSISDKEFEFEVVKDINRINAEEIKNFGIDADPLMSFLPEPWGYRLFFCTDNRFNVCVSSVAIVYETMHPNACLDYNAILYENIKPELSQTLFDFVSLFQQYMEDDKDEDIDLSFEKWIEKNRARIEKRYSDMEN